MLLPILFIRQISTKVKPFNTTARQIIGNNFSQKKDCDKSRREL